MKELPSVLQKIGAERASVSIMTFFKKQFPILFRRPASRPVAASAHRAEKPVPPRVLCIGRIHRGRMTMVAAFPRKTSEGDRKLPCNDRGDRNHGSASQDGKVAGKT